MTTLGAVCVPQVPPERLRDVALAAEDAGLEELWLWEDCFWGGAVPACAAALAWTSRLRVGIGVLPVPLRNVAATAMDTAMLHRLFPGRVTVGVGHGVQSWMRQAGAAAESPMTLLREHLAALRSLLGGETVTIDGRYVRLDEVALEWPPSGSPDVSPPPVLSAATGDRTLRLSGEAADGTVLVAARGPDLAGTGPDEVRRARGLIDTGRARGGRADKHRLVVYMGVARLDAAEAASAAASARALAEAGADAVVLQPADDDSDLDPVELVRFTAERVRPLVPA
ncbi:MAG: LLM class flavin-dependent oxidoreductase [Nocardiopsaceae bacterium]|nr:LLM class flavin-dependent oxidoreductase [Nocardiopsaceae bacterium]